jgi:DNA-directed RNA polymerase beta subunit
MEDSLVPSIRSFDDFIDKFSTCVIDWMDSSARPNDAYKLKLVQQAYFSKHRREFAVNSPAAHERFDATYNVRVQLNIEATDAKDPVSGSKPRAYLVTMYMPIIVKSSICTSVVSRDWLMDDNNRIERLAYEADIGGYFIVHGKRYIITNHIARAQNNLMVTEVKSALTPALARAYKLEHSAAGARVVWNVVASVYEKSVADLSIVGKYKGRSYDVGLLLKKFKISADDILKSIVALLPNLPDAKRGLIDSALSILCAVQPKPEQDVNAMFEGFTLGTHTVATLICMVRRLLLVIIGVAPANNPNILKHKRVNTAGMLYALLVKDVLCKQFASMRKSSEKQEKFIRIGEDEIKTALKSGNWPGKLKGVTSILDTTNSVAMLSNIRKVTSNYVHSDGGSNIIQPRLLQRDYPGRICPIEVPTGENAGLIRNLAIGARITSHFLAPSRHEFFLSWIKEVSAHAAHASASAAVSVWLDGALVSLNNAAHLTLSVDQVPAFIEAFRSWRSAKHRYHLSRDISVEWVDEFGEVHFRADGGRLVRQLRDVKTGAVWWLDPAEEMRFGRVAFSHEYPNDGLQEVSEDSWLGVAASVQPFGNQSQGPRIVYQVSQHKQAAGPMPISVNRHLHPVSGIFLTYPQHPLVQTRSAMDLNGAFPGISFNCYGQNLVTAIMSYEGDGQEDSILIKRSAIERGALCVLSRTSYSGKLETDQEHIREVRNKSKKAHLISEDGLPKVGSSSSKPHPVLIVCKNDEKVMFPTGPVMSHASSKIVISNVQSMTHNATVTVDQMMHAAVGDKFVTKGQKAILGRVVDDVDMPYDSNGISPDVIINAHSFPTRMTVAPIMEASHAKEVALHGHDIRIISSFDTKLEHPSVRDKEVLYDGRTGRPFDACIFMAPFYWQRLKHIATDKSILRGSDGRTDQVTHQPSKGRKLFGGVSHSQMDNFCLLGHNAVQHLHTVLSCDIEPIGINITTGAVDPSSSFTYQTPYPFQMLMNELMCLRILPTFSRPS